LFLLPSSSLAFNCHEELGLYKTACLTFSHWSFIKLPALPSAIPHAMQHIFFSGGYFKNIIP